MTEKHPTNPPQNFPGETPASPPTDKPPVHQTGPDTAPASRDVADPHPSDEEDPYRERQHGQATSASTRGARPTDLGLAQLSDNDHDQTPTAGDAEALTPSE